MSIQTEVEKVFEELKADLMKLFGDHANLHNVVNDAHEKVQEAVADSDVETAKDTAVEGDKDSTDKSNPPV